MNHRNRGWSVTVLTIVALSLGLACLFGASRAIWAAPAGGPAYQLLPTAPPVTSQPTQPAATATPVASPTLVESPAGQEETVVSTSADAAQPFVPPVTFRTPVYGISTTASTGGEVAPGDGYPAKGHAGRNQESRLQDSFAKVFPIWCFWPIVGLILVTAGLDLRARSGRRLR